jgi:hypothetical protein
MDAFQRMNRGEMKMKTKEDELVCGVGTIENMPDDWRKTGCPFYATWHSMLTRCYSRNFQKNNPTYKGVTVCKEWWDLRTFKQWMETKDWKEGKQLDKDILIPGNKEYGPDACMFVDPKINLQGLIDPRKYIGDYAQGVYLRRNKGPNTYVARIGRYGKNESIATFSTVEAAASAHHKAKSEYLRVLAEKQEPILKEALLRWADIYELEVAYLRDNKRWKKKD